MRVLVACENSGLARNAFFERGHDAWSCDLFSGEAPNKDRHLQCDVREVLGQHWDLVIAHPPCTYLCNSGVRWLYEQPDRMKHLEEGAAFFKIFLDCKAEKVCIENPIPHKHAVAVIGRYTQTIQPWQFGHEKTKTTCLWLRGLPLLLPTKVVPRGHGIHLMPPLGFSGMRAWLRSRSYPGVAKAMAEQWG